MADDDYEEIDPSALASKEQSKRSGDVSGENNDELMGAKDDADENNNFYCVKMEIYTHMRKIKHFQIQMCGYIYI